MNRTSRTNGYTLIQLLIVITGLAVLSLITNAVLRRARENARSQTRLQISPGNHTRTVTPAHGTSCTFTTWHSGGANFSFLDGH